MKVHRKIEVKDWGLPKTLDAAIDNINDRLGKITSKFKDSNFRQLIEAATSEALNFVLADMEGSLHNEDTTKFELKLSFPCEDSFGSLDMKKIVARYARFVRSEYFENDAEAENIINQFRKSTDLIERALRARKRSMDQSSVLPSQ